MEDYANYSVRTKYRKIHARVQNHMSVVAETVERQHAQSVLNQAEAITRADLEIEQDHTNTDTCRHSTFDTVRLCEEAGPPKTFPSHEIENLSTTFSSDHDDNYSDIGSGTDDDDLVSLGLRESLAEWAVKFNVSHASLSALLKLLKPSHDDLPSDPRTLLSTPRVSNIVQVAGGSYYHFGIANSIYSQLLRYPQTAENCTSLTLRINIDGLPPHRSTTETAWPILGMLREMQKSVFIIGLFCGMEKPKSIDEYLQEFLSELKQICETGITFQSKQIQITLPDAFICDARAFIKCVKGHSGYYGCERCNQKGVYVAGKVTFREVDANLRTDRQFLEMEQKEHHTRESPLLHQGIDLVSGFVLDYMHLVCLGVTRKLISLWTEGSSKFRIPNRNVAAISHKLLSYRENLPRAFSRKPRSLSEFRQWKATEFRQFLLYTGPVVLNSDYVASNVYKHFMLLSVATRILLFPTLCLEYCDYAKDLLGVFVRNFSKIYGKDKLVYNVHSLIHIADDARKYGALDSVSAFPFENYLGQLKKLARRPQNPLAQIVRRLAERRDLAKESTTESECHKQLHMSGPLPVQYAACRQFKKYNNISSSKADNCFSLGRKVVIVRNILLSSSGETFVVCEHFERKESLFSYPLDSGQTVWCINSCACRAAGL